RKKVAIVCALQHNPRLCILDEPTGGLDPLMQREFFAILKELNQQGTTVFLSSHILSEVQHNCNRAAIIREGQIIACDTVDKLSQTNAKRIHIEGDIDLSLFPDTKDIQREEKGVSFLYGGDINQLIKILSQNKINDLSISDPDLEEIFMHYYLNGGEE
ncbi:MAG: ABC transporter ATP-binding protein, partial [Ruminococcus sp.]